MKKLVVTAAALLAGAAGSAGAADLPAKAPAPAAAYSWTGCHIGVNAGGQWGFNRGAEYLNAANGPAGPSPAAAFAYDTSNNSDGGGMAGGQIGCDYQYYYGVFGIEADGDWQRYSESIDNGPVVPGDKLSFSSKWETSLRARIGYSADRTLVYATGGVTWANMNVEADFVPVTAGGVGIPGTTNSDQQTLVGYTIGAGLEHAITDHLILGLEGRYTNYDGKVFNTGLVAPAGTPPGPYTLASTNTGVRFSNSQIMGRLSWKFDWLGPVVARY